MTCNGDGEEKQDAQEEKRKGLSNHTLGWGGAIAIAGLVTSGIATYNSLQNDITSLKRGEVYQERTNERLSEENKAIRSEYNEGLREINRKLDGVIERLPLLFPQRR
jgi:hypothetical protein